MEKRECINTSANTNIYDKESKFFRTMLTELGYLKTKTVGVWKLSNKPFPDTDIEVCIFVKGQFWINKNGAKVYTGNYMSMSPETMLCGFLDAIN